MATLTLRIIELEGGYSNDPDDRGGETNFGISKRSYPHIDIKNLTAQGAMTIYESNVWRPNRLSEINSQIIAEAVFTLAVHTGHVPGIKILQRALNMCGSNVTVDGRVGVATLNAVNNSNSKWLAETICTQTCRYYIDIVARDKTQLKYFHGWIRRAVLG